MVLLFPHHELLILRRVLRTLLGLSLTLAFRASLLPAPVVGGQLAVSARAGEASEGKAMTPLSPTPRPYPSDQVLQCSLLSELQSYFS